MSVILLIDIMRFLPRGGQQLLTYDDELYLCHEKAETFKHSR